MLQSLEIRNYRNLHHLTIERLGRVNLLLGKNNTGKTSVLEAISIHINRGNIDSLLQLLEERGENYFGKKNQLRNASMGAREAAILKTLSSLFSDRQVQFLPGRSIIIGEQEETIFGKVVKPENSTAIRFVRYLDKYEYENTIVEDDTNIKLRSSRRKRVFLSHDDDDPEAIIGFEVRSGPSVVVLSLSNINRASQGVGSFPMSQLDEQTIDLQFVKTKNIEKDVNGLLWDRVALTESEEEVVNALKIIEPDIDRITFRNEGDRERVAVVKLKSSNDVIPLRSMGDGINRILTIILAMVNCENGYLLIDEFENGLHYTVQEQLWEVIFNVADRLNIQVFATTHSYDCINAFSTVLNSGRYPKESGYMMRLDNYKGNIEATLYDAEETETTVSVDVDPRG